MWRQLVFPRSQTGWRPPSGETIARLQAGECRCLSVTPWICGLHCLLLYFVYKEYNNTSSYPTSIRAAKIKVSITSPSNSNIAIQYRHRPVCQTTIIHFWCYLFCLKGWNSAEQQVQLALWTRRCKDWKILRGGKSWCLSGDHSLK